MPKPIPRHSTTSSVNSIRPDRVRFARRLLFCAALLTQALSSPAQNKPAQIKPATAGYFDATNLRQPTELSMILVSAAACLLYSYALADQLSFFSLTANQQLVLQLPYDLLIVLLVPALLLLDWRRGNREAGILLIPLLLSNFVIGFDAILSLLTQIAPVRDPAIEWTNLLNNTVVGPFHIDPIRVTDILYAVSMALIILLRTNRLSREGAVFESELAAAREVQQVLVPEAIETIPGFSIETAYLPAADIAQQAKAFGQSDDITVLAILRTA